MRLDRKTLGRVATTFMATAMLAAFAAVPAMADDGVHTGNDFAINSVLRVPAKIATPAVSFDYTIGTKKPDGSEIKDNLTVYEGEAGALIFSGDDATKTVTYATGAPSTDLKGSEPNQYYEVTESLTLHAIPERFPHAGVYKYEITVQNTPSVAGITTDGYKTVYVYAADESGNDGVVDTINAIVMQDQDSTKAKSGSFTHSYLFKDENPDPETLSSNLVLSKTVAGAYGNKQGDFQFAVTVTPKATGTQYYYERGTVDEQGQFTATTGNGLISSETSIKLQHGQAIKIYGLMTQDTYTVEETDYTNQGYKTEVSINKSAATETHDATGTITDQDVSVAYTNTRSSDSVTPTGVLLNVAPYALMVIIAVAAAFVFLRKRRDD